jgi:hypothetical protein
MSSAADEWIKKGRRVQRTAAGVLAPVLSAPVDDVRAEPNVHGAMRPTITRPTPEKPTKMKLLEIVNRALACCAGLPEREVKERTAKAYIRTFTRMRHEPALDPLKDNIARNTYNYRRAALHFGSRRLLMFLINRCADAGAREDSSRLQHWVRVLHRALNLIEPVLALEPPLQRGASTWSMPTSRWTQVDQPRPRRGKHGKKHVLKRLKRDWMDQLWNAVPVDWAYCSQLAVHMLAPSRPEDLTPGTRPGGWTAGAQVHLRSPNLMEITIAPAKSHGGKFGSPSVTISWDPTLEGRAAAYLAELCSIAGGRIVVAVDNKNAMRKALGRLGQRVFPEFEGNITAYVIRNQVMADLKATVGAGETVAASAGQCTDRTQSYYGRAEHGRKRKGFLGAISARQPRTGNIVSARRARAKAQRQQRGPDAAPN